MIEISVRATVVRVTGRFDRDSASELRRKLSAAWGTEPGTVVIDFSFSAEVSDVGLVALLEPLHDGALRLRFRGLTHRQRKLMRVLAATTEPPPARMRRGAA